MINTTIIRSLAVLGKCFKLKKTDEISFSIGLFFHLQLFIRFVLFSSSHKPQSERD